MAQNSVCNRGEVYKEQQRNHRTELAFFNEPVEKHLSGGFPPFLAPTPAWASGNDFTSAVSQEVGHWVTFVQVLA